MSRFAKLSLKKFATLKHMGTLMAEIMILERRLEVQDPPQYQECRNVPRQACRSVPRQQGHNVPKHQCRSIPCDSKPFKNPYVPIINADMFQDKHAEMFQGNNATTFLTRFE